VIRLLKYLPFLTLLLSCAKQKYPDSVVENGAVYFFRGEVDGRPVSFAAGVNDYYMYSSYSQSADSVVRFKGVLRKLDCDGCDEQLGIEIHDYRKNVAAFNGDSAFKTGIRAYHETPLFTQVAFQSLFNKTAQSVRWDFGDGATSDLQAPIHLYRKPGIYPICHSVTGTGGCASQVCNMEIIDSAASRAVISSLPAGNRTLAFNALVEAKPPVNYLWDFGDGTVSQQQSPVHSFPVEGAYPVRLRTIDSKGDTAFAVHNAVTSKDISSCAANYRIVSVTSLYNPGFSEIKLTWKDKNGRLFTTHNVLQPADSYFEITETTDAGTNEKGEGIVKITARLSSMVSDGISFRRIRADISFAVSHPN
jgi:PKD repeat protein